MSDPFIGEIRMFCGNFAPVNWATCDGQIMSIAQNTALFSILGTTFGGNGTSTFALPDFRGRVPIHAGQGPGLSPYVIGEIAGTETVSLLTTQIPAHGHPFTAPCNNSVQATTANDPTSGYPGAIDPNNPPIYAASANAAMGAGMTGVAGGSQPHPNIQPFTCVTFIIALFGIFPSRG